MKPGTHILLAACVAAAAACGGSSANSNDTLVGNGLTDAVATGDALPAIPSAPVAAPEALFARLSLGDPKGQMAAVASFVDAVQPGMGTVINEQSLSTMLSAAAGTGGLAGVDWTKPIFLLRLDQAVVPAGSLLVVGVADEKAMIQAVSGNDVKVMSHNGFAAIGSKKALQVAAPHALTALVAGEVAAEPSFVLWVDKLISQQSETIDSLFRELDFNADEKKQMLALARELVTVSGRASFGATAASVDLAAAFVAQGRLAEMAAAQTASDYSVAQRLGTADAALFLAGNLDFALIAPFVLKAVSRADAAALPIAEALVKTKGQMAMRGVGPEPGRFAAIYTLADAHDLLATVNTMASDMAKKGPQKLGERIATVTLNKVRHPNGNLHEVSYKPDPKLPEARKKALLKKTKSKAYFGVNASSMLAFYGPGGPAGAKQLIATNAGKSSPVLDTALKASKTRGESVFAGIDVAAMGKDGVVSNLPPLTIGVQFAADAINMKAELPVEQARAVSQRGM